MLPLYQEKENRPNEELADNSMVIQPQHSELVCKNGPVTQNSND